ncbi:RNA polymerase sigma-70 factor (ECF subfamily) [Clostridium acetobutylicum]|uniref:SigX n=1 Tax=Clostridium acetobutylicum (strain ATCC 824 / DSM 792 / JCM 1419 / IAM 19013 / LMG 5710 / NBRC 13948 / NRRL B-527 / VKM B-1787 / 2291 / W) TaxID=272562 RepID=O65997_CLOAB|nr:MULTISPECIES: ECF subfamily RNA polymerase sigma factor, BldN family [Clostridium]AAC12856.1 SigX [Clostridium acetobutylicum ATCC 824]AAK79476.1 Specialized sigma subunit of RNA polymerase [Clostridium acetobutylicum ATCC 824]ADZ20561.1 Specialized sigma subunit of RNA polymerase [Clostridium acetobutylicum EA 2018]AEI33293.1 specialized sigma subunit of RNA polymerase [Clostridium acetobutylicum DSM 1731]AWV81279.1 RNA polymerase subunit sigma-24 [Clostridium acetobutylicum]
MEQSILSNLDKMEDRERAFSYIFETYSKRVYNYIYYRVNCQYTAEDLMSKIFEKVMLKIDSYSEKKSSFEVWLFTIARNVLNDYFRGLKRHTLFSLDVFKELLSNEPNPEEAILKEEANYKLLKALKILSKKERHIIALKFGANLKNKEISELLGIKSNNVGIILFRTIKKLKSQMEREGYIDE